MKQSRGILFGLSLTIALLPFASAQTTPDPNTQQLLTKVLTAFAGGKTVASVTMQGTAKWSVGSDEQAGTALLVANANGQSRMELGLERGKRVETEDAYSATSPKCTWTGFDGQQHESALHNCFGSTVWFLPQITWQPGAGGTNAAFSLQGPTALHQERQVSPNGSKTAAELLQKTSVRDIALDTNTALPVSMSFNLHPDNNAVRDIPVEVRYSNYHQVDGITLPFTIEKLMNHVRFLELDIQSATVDFGAVTQPAVSSIIPGPAAQ